MKPGSSPDPNPGAPSDPAKLRIRPGAPGDAEPMAAILNHYIAHTTATFHAEPVDAEDRRRFIVERAPHHPIWVVESDGELLGWAALSTHRPRISFSHTVEHSIYLHPGHTGRGIGRRLLRHAVEGARAQGFHTLVAGVCTEQAASLALHESAGFVRVAHFREIARKFERWLDVVYLQLMLRAGEGGRGETGAP